MRRIRHCAVPVRYIEHAKELSLIRSSGCGNVAASEVAFEKLHRNNSEDEEEEEAHKSDV